MTCFNIRRFIAARASIALLTIALSSLGALSMMGCSSSSGSGESQSSTALATITTKSEQSFTGFPHKIDYYVPSNATTAIVFLHGGGGKKEGFANGLGLKADSTQSNYALTTDGAAWLKAQKVVAVFPQGQTNVGANWTWDNYVMVSSASDVAFLQALVASIKSDPTLPAISKVYVVGHSNGGMMANRMWCESPTTFDGYATIAGPPSTHLAPTGGSNPCAPTTVQPYIGMIGDHDKVLQTASNMAALTWTINPVVVISASAWADATPRVLNDKLFYTSRVTMKCSGSVATPVTSGQLTTYSDCANTLKFVVVAQATLSGQPNAGDHCVGSPSGPCDTTLSGATGFDPKTAAMDFFKSL